MCTGLALSYPPPLCLTPQFSLPGHRSPQSIEREKNNDCFARPTRAHRQTSRATRYSRLLRCCLGGRNECFTPRGEGGKREQNYVWMGWLFASRPWGPTMGNMWVGSDCGWYMSGVRLWVIYIKVYVKVSSDQCSKLSRSPVIAVASLLNHLLRTAGD